MRILTSLLIAGTLCFGLSACNSEAPKPELIVQVPIVITPPASLLVCHVRKLPLKFNSDHDMGALFLKVYNDNVQCFNNVNAIKKFNEKAKKEYLVK